MEYFAQDEATRLDPTLTVYETLQAGSPMQMVPMIRHILGGFLFSGDDVYKRAGVLSGGERTRLAVARMLLRPSNTLLLDEPTNHLDLDSKDVLLDALMSYGGTLIFVSHDRYFVERLATKIIEIGHGHALVYPGTYKEFLWHREHAERSASRCRAPREEEPRPSASLPKPKAPSQQTKGGDQPGARKAAAGSRFAATSEHEARKRERAEQKKRDRELQARTSRVTELEARIADREQAIKELEAAMAAPGFYDDRAAAQQTVDRHQALMWEVGELMHQWETLSAMLSKS